ncbi:MAG: S8 family peptidase [Hyphomonadaceae bacterium]
MTSKPISLRNALIAATGLIFTGGALAACDQQDTRKNQLETLVDDVLDQIVGDDTAASPPSALESAAPAERAISGRLSADARARITEERTRFAIGSIVAKPRDIDLVQAAAEEEALLLEEGPLALEEEALPPPAPAPVFEVEPPAEGGADVPQGVQAAPPPPVLRERNGRAPRSGTRRLARDPSDMTRQEMKATRRMARGHAVREVQLDAQSTMLGEMNKLGLSGTVESSDSGMMVIDLFADPTQFVEDGSPAPLIAEDIEVDCPEGIAPETMGDDKVLATNCMVELLRASGEFEYVEKDYIFDHQFTRRPAGVPLPVSFAPNDTLWDLQWNFLNNGTEAGESAGGAGFVDFWSRTGITGSTDVTIAVVDTGLALNHPDIAASPNIAPGWDMVSDPGMGNDGDGRDSDPNDPGDLCNPNVPFARDSFHGTHVAGTIGAAASNNGSGVAGGAWDVTIVPVRALGKCGGRLSDIIAAIRWAGGIIPAEGKLGEEVWNENPADIINLSIGLFEICPASLQDAIDTVVERGVVVVSAAGNARLPTEFYAPGGCNNVISVAASDARGHITPYSNFGPEVDLLAPGGDLLRDDNHDDRPDGILSTKPSSDCYDPITGEEIASCYYAYEQGTSMAAPHVSAALALIAAQNPEMTGAQLEATLMGAVTPRETDQCSAPCDQYPGATPIPDSEGMCLRTCGAGLLNLEKLPN